MDLKCHSGRCGQRHTHSCHPQPKKTLRCRLFPAAAVNDKQAITMLQWTGSVLGGQSCVQRQALTQELWRELRDKGTYNMLVESWCSIPTCVHWEGEWPALANVVSYQVAQLTFYGGRSYLLFEAGTGSLVNILQMPLPWLLCVCDIISTATSVTVYVTL